MAVTLQMWFVILKIGWNIRASIPILKMSRSGFDIGMKRVSPGWKSDLFHGKLFQAILHRILDVEVNLVLTKVKDKQYWHARTEHLVSTRCTNSRTALSYSILVLGGSTQGHFTSEFPISMTVYCKELPIEIPLPRLGDSLSLGAFLDFTPSLDTARDGLPGAHVILTTAGYCSSQQTGWRGEMCK